MFKNIIKFSAPATLCLMLSNSYCENLLQVYQDTSAKISDKNLSMQVIERYFSVLTEYNQLSLQIKNLKLNKDIVQTLITKYRMGMINKARLENAKLLYDDSKHAAKLEKHQYKLALNALYQLAKTKYKVLAAPGIESNLLALYQGADLQQTACKNLLNNKREMLAAKQTSKLKEKNYYAGATSIESYDNSKKYSNIKFYTYLNNQNQCIIDLAHYQQKESKLTKDYLKKINDILTENIKLL